MVIAANLLTLTSCASTSPLDWLQDEHADAIAEDLAIAVAARVPPSESPVFVAEMPLRDHFENAIRAHGYAVAANPEEAIEISGLGERIPPNTWHVGLTVDDGIKIHRLYHIDQGDVQALSSISVGEHEPLETAEHIGGTTSWHLRSLATPTTLDPVHQKPLVLASLSDQPITVETSTTLVPRTSAPLPDPKETDSPSTALKPVAVNVSDCPSTDGAVLTFPIGSLKQGLVDALSLCNWRVVSWPTDAINDVLIVDWVVTRETTVHIDSIEDLLAGLKATYGLDASIDDVNREIAFSMDVGI